MNVTIEEMNVTSEESQYVEYYYHPTPEDFLKPWLSNASFIPIVTINCITFIFGVLGNMLVIVTMLGDRASRNVTSTFLVSLAAADLLLLLIVIPYETVRYFVINWSLGGDLMCKTVGFVETLSALASVLNLTAVSIERYVVIIYPMRSRSWCTMSNCKRILLGTWVLAILLSSPVFFYKAIHEIRWGSSRDPRTHVTQFTCIEVQTGHYEQIIVIYHLVMLFVLPAAVMTFCYARVVKALWVSHCQLQTMTQSNAPLVTKCESSSLPPQTEKVQFHIVEGSGGHYEHKTLSPDSDTTPQLTPQEVPSLSNRGRPCSKKAAHGTGASAATLASRKQVIKMMVAVVLLFIVCWGPKLFLTTMLRFELVETFGEAIYWTRFLVNMLPIMHSAMNPLVYFCMSTTFRRKCLSRLSCCAKDVITTGAPYTGGPYTGGPYTGVSLANGAGCDKKTSRAGTSHVASHVTASRSRGAAAPEVTLTLNREETDPARPALTAQLSL